MPLPYSRTENAILYDLGDPLPYVYTQDRWRAMELADQSDALFQLDLREAVLIMPSERVASWPQAPVTTDSVTERFAALQQLNRVQRVEFAPNRLTIDIDVRRAAMLVVCECWHPGWHVDVDGKPARLHRVNYLQQGVWLEPGRHLVRLTFVPPVLRIATWVCGASWLLAAALVAVSCKAKLHESFDCVKR